MTDLVTPKKAAGEWLLAQMHEKGIGVRQVAGAADVTTQAVYQWIKGQRPVSPEKANLVAGALGLPASYVWDRLGLTLPADVDVIAPEQEAATLAAMEAARAEEATRNGQARRTSRAQES